MVIPHTRIEHCSVWTPFGDISLCKDIQGGQGTKIMIKNLLLVAIFGCLIQYSVQDKCFTGPNGGLDTSYLTSLSISTFNHLINNMGTLVAEYEYCAVEAATFLNVAGMSCSLDQIKQALCAANSLQVLFDWQWGVNGTTVQMVMAACIPPQDACTYFADLFKSVPGCFYDELMESSDLFVSVCARDYESTSGGPIKMDILLYLPPDILYDYVGSLSNSHLSQLLDDVLDRPSMFELFDCEAKIDFMELIEQVGLLSPKISHISGLANKYTSSGSLTTEEEADMALFLNFFPYYTTNLCNSVINAVGEFLLNNTRFLQDVRFECREQDSLVYNVTQAGSDSLFDTLAAQENTTRDALVFLYDRLKFSDDFLCNSGCGATLVDKALTFLPTLTPSNIRSTLGPVGDCIDDSAKVSLIGTLTQGKCGDLSAGMLGDEFGLIDPLWEAELRSKCRPPSPESMTVQDVVDLGCYALCAYPEISTRIPANTLCEAIGTNLQWSCFLVQDECQDMEIVQYVLDVCSSHANINALKSGVKQFLSFVDQVAQVTISELSDITTKMTKAGMSDGIIDSMLYSIMTKDINAVDFSHLSEDILNRIDEDSLGTILQKTGIDEVLNSVSKMTKGINRVQGGEIIARMLSAKTTIDLPTLKNISSNLKTSLNTSHIQQFKSCGAGEFICMQELCKKLTTGQWDGLRADVLAEQFLAALETAAGGADFSKMLLPTDIAKIDGACLRKLNSTHIEKLSGSLLKEVCKAFASDKRRLCDQQTAGRQAVAKACFKTFGVDIDQAGTQLTDTIIEMAHLLLDTSEAAALFQPTFYTKGGAAKVAACPFLLPDAMKNTMITNLRTAMDYNTISKWNIKTIGCWLPALYGGATTDGQRTEIYKFITKNLNTLKTYIESAEVVEELECLKSSVDSTILAELEASFTEWLDTVSQAGISSSASVAGRRRRRSTITTCSNIQTIPVQNLPSQVTTATINGMTDAEIATCLSYLGQATGWSSEQSTAILSKASTYNSWTTRSSITAGNLQTMGTIAYAFTVTDIQGLTISDDAVSQLGSLHSWTDAQVQAIASRYLTAKSLTAATLTSQQLKLMMHTVCGVSSVSQILPANYKSAASSLGKINHATSNTCLKSLAGLATHANAYGPASAWTLSTYNSVGTVAAGLTGEELNYASRDAVDSMGTLVKYIPPTELQKLSTTVLGYFNRQQVLSLTNDQLALMNSEQRAVLQSTSAVTITVAYSSAGGFNASITAMMIPMMLALLMH